MGSCTCTPLLLFFFFFFFFFGSFWHDVQPRCIAYTCNPFSFFFFFFILRMLYNLYCCTHVLFFCFFFSSFSLMKRCVLEKTVHSSSTFQCFHKTAYSVSASTMAHEKKKNCQIGSGSGTQGLRGIIHG